jgi:hypothetical protein
MKYKTYITQLKQKFFKKKPVIRDPQLMHPEREWSVGLVIAVLVFSLCGLWSIYTYLKNRSISASPIEQNTQQTVYRESVVSEALEIVAKRKRTLDQLTSQTAELVIVEVVATTTTPVEEEVVEQVIVPVETPAVPTLGD